MRAQGRLLVYTAVAFSFLLALWRLSAVETKPSLSDGISRISFVPYGSKTQASEALPSPRIFETVEELWHTWSAIFYRSRPQSPAIFLEDKAEDIRIDDDNGTPRSPFRELVVNGKSDIKSLRKSHAHFIEELGKQETLASSFLGYGVVTLGGGEYFGPAITSIQMLRRTGCRLPVEVFVANDAEYEEFVCKEFLPKLNAKCLVISHFLGKGAHRFHQRHYQLKALAILFTSFQHVLYIDSDSIPLVDPYQQLMKSEPYLSQGMVIWPDFWLSTESPSYYDIAGLDAFPTNLPKTASETGQMLVNKRTHLPTLLLATYYNIYGPNWYYPLMSQGAKGQGDKETFLAAAVVLNQTFWRVRTPVMALMNDDGTKSEGRAMVQYHCGDDFSNAQQYADAGPGVKPRPARPAFLHANVPKMNAGHLMDEEQIWSKEKADTHLRLLGRIEHQDEVFGYDIESALWEHMGSTACELADKLKDWKDREDLCLRVQDHIDILFKGKHPTSNDEDLMKSDEANLARLDSGSKQEVESGKPEAKKDNSDADAARQSQEDNGKKQEAEESRGVDKKEAPGPTQESQPADKDNGNSSKQAEKGQSSTAEVAAPASTVQSALGPPIESPKATETPKLSEAGADRDPEVPEKNTDFEDWVVGLHASDPDRPKPMPTRPGKTKDRSRRRRRA